MAAMLLAASRCSSQGIQLGLGPIRRLLQALGHPESGLDFLHVAGTNGKGSTLAFLEAVLSRAGYPVASYTSPHLERFQERIRVHGAPVADHVLTDYLEEVLQANADQEATFFELTTALALRCFASLPVGDGLPRRPILWETGLGGRLDATNAVQPVLTLITAIDLDHQDYLGDTIQKVAREKAGILKPGIGAVADPVHPAAVAVIRAQAKATGTPLWLRGEGYDWTSQPDGSWIYEDASGLLHLPQPGLAGDHQYGNAALAVAGIRRLILEGWPIAEEAIAIGIAGAVWPGRLEQLVGTPPIWLDGAHNPAATAALVAALRKDPASLAGLWGIVFAVFGDKDAPAMIRLLAPLARQVWLPYMADQPRQRSPEEVATIWRDHGVAVVIAESPASALADAKACGGDANPILVTGSLSLVGAIRTMIITGTEITP